jgi:hypothetical protein
MKKSAFLLAYLAMSLAVAQAVELVCPASVQVESKIIDIPAPWHSYARKMIGTNGDEPFKAKLMGIKFVGGAEGNEPNNTELLAPNNSASADCDGSQCVNHWGGLSAKSTWVMCEYGESAYLAMPLPEGVTTCHISFGKDANKQIRAWCSK